MFDIKLSSVRFVITLIIVSLIIQFVIYGLNGDINENINYYSNQYENRIIFSNEILETSIETSEKIIEDLKSIVFDYKYIEKYDNVKTAINDKELYEFTIIKPLFFDKNDIGKVKLVYDLKSLREEFIRVNDTSNEDVQNKDFISNLNRYNLVVYEKLLSENEKLVMYVNRYELNRVVKDILNSEYNSDKNKLKEKIIDTVNYEKSEVVYEKPEEIIYKELNNTIYSVEVNTNPVVFQDLTLEDLKVPKRLHKIYDTVPLLLIFIFSFLNSLLVKPKN